MDESQPVAPEVLTQVSTLQGAASAAILFATTVTPPAVLDCTTCAGLPTVAATPAPSNPTITTAHHPIYTSAFQKGPLSYSEIWYRQPWTWTAAAMLYLYALCSILTLILLMATGLMDRHLNVSVSHVPVMR